jgi:hypothetical protein
MNEKTGRELSKLTEFGMDEALRRGIGGEVIGCMNGGESEPEGSQRSLSRVRDGGGVEELAGESASDERIG